MKGLCHRFRNNTEDTGCKHYLKNRIPETSLAAQWLRLHVSTAGAAGSIPDRGTKIPYAARRGQKKKIEFLFFTYTVKNPTSKSDWF